MGLGALDPLLVHSLRGSTTSLPLETEDNGFLPREFAGTAFARWSFPEGEGRASSYTWALGDQSFHAVADRCGSVAEC